MPYQNNMEPKYEEPIVKPVNGEVHPPFIPPPNKPHRNTNQLQYLAKNVIKVLRKHENAWPFCEPVNSIKLKLPFYHQVIKRPMDLRTIRKRLKNHYYYTSKECLRDIKLIFENCYAYYERRTDVVLMAEVLERLADSLISSMPVDEIEIPIPNQKTDGEKKINNELEMESERLKILNAELHSAEYILDLNQKGIQTEAHVTAQIPKLEDALSYLDRIKYYFGNQPQVYNDFLDIMKEFRSGSIDTSGVIQRVSKLFRDHPEFIAGFNTFLPPSYWMPAEQVSTSIEAAVTSLTIHPTSPPNSLQQHPVTHSAQTNDSSLPHSSPPGNDTAGYKTRVTAHVKRPTMDDALSYLNQVKCKLGNQPQVYNYFLDLLEEFKSRSIDIPVVLQQVSNLFRDHPELILGFNTFIHSSYRIEVQPNEQAAHSTPFVIKQSHSNSQNQHVFNPSSPAYSQLSGGTPTAVAIGGRCPSNIASSAAPSPSQHQQQTSQQPDEFNHPINYVNKIS